MKNLGSIPGVVADADYVNGKIQDNVTTIGEAINQDIIQFFQKLISLTATLPNDVYDNEVNGYQTLEALEEFVRSLAASLTEKGSIELATQTEVDTGTDANRAVTPATLQGKAASLTAKGIIELATQTEVDTGTDAARAVTPATLKPFTGGLKTAVVEIIDWDMAATSTKIVSYPAGVAFADVVAASAWITKDTGTTRVNFEVASPEGTGTDLGGTILLTSTQIALTRFSGGWFNSTDYDTASGHRGWLVINYKV